MGLNSFGFHFDSGWKLGARGDAVEAKSSAEKWFLTRKYANCTTKSMKSYRLQKDVMKALTDQTKKKFDESWKEVEETNIGSPISAF